jgi:hypothetical protein
MNKRATKRKSAMENSILGKEKKSPTSPGLVSPACTCLKLCLTQVLFNKRRMQVKCLSLFNLTRLCEYNSAKEICKYPSFSKVGGNYPLDLKIIWSSVYQNQLLYVPQWKLTSDALTFLVELSSSACCKSIILMCFKHFKNIGFH